MISSEAGCSAHATARTCARSAAHSADSENGSAVFVDAATASSATRHKKIPPKDFDGENVIKNITDLL